MPETLTGKIVANGYGHPVQVLAVHDELALIRHPEWGTYVTQTHHVIKFTIIGQMAEEERLALLPTWYTEAVAQRA
jgi:hypothetical protein